MDLREFQLDLRPAVHQAGLFLEAFLAETLVTLKAEEVPVVEIQVDRLDSLDRIRQETIQPQTIQPKTGDHSDQHHLQHLRPDLRLNLRLHLRQP